MCEAPRPVRRGDGRATALFAALLSVMMAATVGLAGCASPGGEQNYKELERDPEPLQPEQDPMFGPTGAKRDTPHAHPDATVPGGRPVAMQSAKRPTDPATQPATQPATTRPRLIREQLVPAKHAGPTLQGADRSDWTPVRVAAVAANFQHPPVYYHTPLPPDDTAPLLTGPVARRLHAAAADTDDDPYAGENLALLPGEPGLFFGETALLPAYMILTPPWQQQNTQQQTKP